MEGRTVRIRKLVATLRFVSMTILQAAGSVAKLFEHPFDLVKVRLQSQPWANDKPLQFKGPVDCFGQTFRNEGVRGLYRVSMLCACGR
jgi:hypothetical protein